jgi:hypothetical protein
MTAPFRTRQLMDCVNDLHSPIGRMIAVQMTAYPDHWSEADKREEAQRQLFHPHIGDDKP